MKKIFMTLLFSIFVLVGLTSLPVCAAESVQTTNEVEKLLKDFPYSEVEAQSLRIAEEFNGKTIGEDFSIERDNGNLVISFSDNQFIVTNKKENLIIKRNAQLIDGKLLIDYYSCTTESYNSLTAIDIGVIGGLVLLTIITIVFNIRKRYYLY